MCVSEKIYLTVVDDRFKKVKGAWGMGAHWLESGSLDPQANARWAWLLPAIPGLEGERRRNADQ